MIAGAWQFNDETSKMTPGYFPDATVEATAFTSTKQRPITPPAHLRPSIFKPDAQRLIEQGFTAIALVPVMFDYDETYLHWPNWYLQERATGRWHPSELIKRRLRPRTIDAMAENLLQWVWWGHTRELCWMRAGYADVLAFQNDLHKGQWSPSQRPLAPATSNARADDATHFLRWAAHRQLRDDFEVPLTTRRLQIAGRLRTVTARTGRLKDHGARKRIETFVLPRPEEVRDWLRALRRQRGYAKYLACSFILEVGARVAEVEKLEVATWPKSEAIEAAISNGDVSVPMTLIHGVKNGTPRTVQVPVRHALAVRTWIDGPRKNYTFALHKRTRETTTVLFISDRAGWAGTSIKRHTILDCFKEITPRPRGWHTHKGRHAFACFFILHALEIEARLCGSTVAGMGVNWIYGRGSEWLRILQRQFGHTDETTTNTYLRWLVTASGLAEAANGWHSFLNSDQEFAE